MADRKRYDSDRGAGERDAAPGFNDNGDAGQTMGPVLTRRTLLQSASAIALLTACQPAIGNQPGYVGEPFSDGTYFTDGTGFI